jgi:hypothetical protein
LLVDGSRERPTAPAGKQQIVLPQTSLIDPVTQKLNETGLEGNLPSYSSVTSRQLTPVALREHHVANPQGASLPRTQCLLGHGEHEGVHRAIGTRVPTYPLEQRSNLLHGKQPFFVHYVDGHSD